MALDTVADYLREARVLLQDGYAPYRYTDQELVDGLNRSLLEVRRIRPDLMIGTFTTTIPTYSPSSPTTAVDFEPMYRTAVLYYVCGNAHMRDEEAIQDSRAAAFLNKFTAQLLMTKA